jgi:Na+/proline symporter
MTERSFHAADYAVFILVLVGTAAVGVVQGIIAYVKKRRGGGKSEEEEREEMATRNLSVWPASLSIMASVSAAPFVLGVPAEIYVNGTMFFLIIIGYIALPVMSHIMFERWYKMGITSMYEVNKIFAKKPYTRHYFHFSTLRSDTTKL